MKQIILGTAGHIDHGKTSLVKALTGRDTDRLKEEKQRGITIELGFASLDLPEGIHIGIVDVPGHEKFIKNMVAGASGIDVVAMIIAADEGVMPQTREHLEICTLLGIKNGFVVLTKTDLVDEEWIELVADDIAEFTKDTFLENSPVVRVSSVTKDGIDELLSILTDFAQKIPRRFADGLFRIPVDRVFSMKGFGTVITGTLISGKINNGETIMIYPQKITSKIRGLQVHDSPVETSEAGARTAINFQGMEKAIVNRGDIIARPDTLFSSYMLDASLQLLGGNKRPLKNRDQVRLHIGTSQIACNVILLESDRLAPGQTATVQLRLDDAIACVRGDRFVIRGYSPVRTLGGGEVVNPVPKKHKRFRTSHIEELKQLAKAADEKLVGLHILSAGFDEIKLSKLLVLTNLTSKALDRILQSLMSDKEVIRTDRTSHGYIHARTFETFSKNVSDILSAFHRENPLKSGMPKGELRSRMAVVENIRLFNRMVDMMINAGTIIAEDENLRLSGHTISLGADQTDIREKLLAIYSTTGLQPPYFKDVCKEMGGDKGHVKNVLMHLVDKKKIVRVKDELFFDRAAITELQKRVVDFLLEHGEIDTGRFKEMTGVSRKYTIPLFEYFDANNITIRVGDVRKLRARQQ
ncbi:MAG: selenocysteine-specific translation elongation factor [Deltaproteobacteria bacterium]|nr:selenocysteine-specific translation elongation factor [Deltaproteobacteria bacterium]